MLRDAKGKGFSSIAGNIMILASLIIIPYTGMKHNKTTL